MLMFAKHLLTGLKDAVNLRALKPMNCDYSSLSAARPRLDAILNDPLIAEEWREAEATHARLTSPLNGATPAGGVNPGDQRVLFSLVRSLKPRSVLEVGTHLGYSTIHIAQALKLNRKGGVDGALTSVDILDVNSSSDGPWVRLGAPRSPQQAIAELGYGDHVTFSQSDSVDYLASTNKTFDLIFLDGDHAAPKVYQEIQLLQRLMSPDTILLLHDYFPDGRALWPGSLPNTGPWRAIRRLRREGAPIAPIPLGALPWPTKLGSNLTSLALLART